MKASAPKMKHTTAITAALFLTTALVTAQEPTKYPSATNLTPTVTVVVSPSTYTVTARYAYTVANSPQSVQKVENFSVDCDSTVGLSTTAPFG